MQIGIIGTGGVGQTLGAALASKGHSVMMGARSAGNEAATGFAAEHGGQAGTFAEAARFGEIVIVAVGGGVALDAVALAGADNLAGKTVIDVTNPLDFSGGFPPVLLPHLSNTTSLGEQIQAALPAAHVVKTWNMMTAAVMVAPETLPEPTDIFLAGDDAGAKATVRGILMSFGWADPVDLGPIRAARGMEQYLPLWLAFMQATGGPNLNIKLVC